MDPELVLIKKQLKYAFLSKKNPHQQQNDLNLKQKPFKNPKIEYFLTRLDDYGIQKSEIEHISDFFRYQVRRNRRFNTIQQYYHAIKRLFLFIGPLKFRFAQINRDDLGAFIEYLQDSSIMSSTINTNLTLLYSFFGFLIEKEAIKQDIMRHKFRLKMPDLLPKAIDPDDIRLLISVNNEPRESALIMVLLRTGMRIGELLGTKVTDIDLKERKIQIHQAQKNYEGRIVYMSDDACNALKAWYSTRIFHKEYVFYGSGNREKLSYPRARQLFIKCAKKAGLSHKGYTLHCLRHTFASELLNAGMRLECLQVLLGHRNIEVTRRYARLTDNTRKEEYFNAMKIIEQGEINGHYQLYN